MAKEITKKTITKKTTKDMPKAALKEKKAVKVIKKMRKGPAVLTEVAPVSVTKTKKSFNPIVFVKVLLIVAVGVVVFLLAQKYRSLFVAGMVNKSPITRWELNKKMAEKYGSTTLEEIISQRLLDENLKKNKISVTAKEVADELAKIVEQYGGQDQFKAAIAQYGMTEAQAEASIKQSIGLKKLVETTNKIEVTEAQIKQYFDDNKTSFTGKKLEEVSAEIKGILYQQEIYTKSQEWYSQVRQSAKVSNFIQ